MEVCDRWGLPHRIFLGAPWPAPGEPLWTDADVAKQMAYVRHRRGFCPRCGQWLGDYLDAEGKELKDPPFEVIERLHPCCELLEDAQEERAGNKKHGVHLAFRLIPDDRPEAASSP